MRLRTPRAYTWAAIFFARHKKIRTASIATIVLFFCGMILYSFVFAAPLNFPDGSLLRIKKGSTLSETALLLQSKHIVSSAFIFEWMTRTLHKGSVVVAGEYSFSEREGMLTLMRRVTSGDFQLAPVKIRVQDGMSVKEISNMLRQKLPDFDADGFYALAVAREGKMFPDTYFFRPGEEPGLVADTMEKNFNEHIREVGIATSILEFGKPLEEVLTMASLLEKEAPETKDRRIIAGILWRRIEAGMLLQVDAVFPYIIGKNSFNLTRQDLRTNSPYNTYKYKGLPPGPIGSPSLDSIMSAVTPLKTSYVYYLSDLDGAMHYSTTYDQHLEKKNLYLD